MNFAIPYDQKVKLKESGKKCKSLDLTRELKKTMEHKGESYINCSWCTWKMPKGLVKGLEDL